MAELDPVVVVTILAMSVTTYATKAGGFWLLSRIELSPRIERGLDALPGAIVVSLLAPELTKLGPAGWIAATAVLVVAWRNDGTLAALGVGMVTVVALRALL
ncbi:MULTISPECIES: AzlD domain-containing protein [Halobellus]|uniref:AzlD family protein n=1 Tax=Halobellus TaxID=1073986 RepID=UPI00211390F3|nr:MULTISPECIES: AzlD domain-containing protein [Halobellus]MDQ2055414.1 AzlD domain-containing protein [Halobellus sp. H-GB7]